MRGQREDQTYQLRSNVGTYAWRSNGRDEGECTGHFRVNEADRFDSSHCLVPFPFEDTHGTEEGCHSDYPNISL
jgi:hypothetical protein